MGLELNQDRNNALGLILQKRLEPMKKELEQFGNKSPEEQARITERVRKILNVPEGYTLKLDSSPEKPSALRSDLQRPGVDTLSVSVEHNGKPLVRLEVNSERDPKGNASVAAYVGNTVTEVPTREDVQRVLSASMPLPPGTGTYPMKELVLPPPGGRTN